MLTPSETLRRLGYSAGQTLADIGCGTGLFTFPAAEIADGAAVYAVDVSADMLADVRAKADAQGVTTIQTIQSGPYDFKLPEGSADFILLCAVLHEIDDPSRFSTEARRIAAPGATIAVIDFNEKQLGFGPSPDHRISPVSAGTLLTNAGFSAGETLSVGEAFYAVTARA